MFNKKKSKINSCNENTFDNEFRTFTKFEKKIRSRPEFDMHQIGKIDKLETYFFNFCSKMKFFKLIGVYLEK